MLPFGLKSSAAGTARNHFSRAFGILSVNAVASLGVFLGADESLATAAVGDQHTRPDARRRFAHPS